MLLRTLFYSSLIFNFLEARSAPGDVVEALTVGYQAWFTCAGDNSPRGGWSHWSNTQPPAPGFLSFEIWPDMSEYTSSYQTGFGNLNNGNPAMLFSSWDDQTIDVHFNWMNQHGIKTAALQRFGAGLSNPSEQTYLNGIANKAIAASVKYGRKLYIMYDISSWTTFQEDIQNDWANLENWIQYSVYARQNDKPVVCIWGFGFSDRPGDADSALATINFLKSKNLYVIGGVPKFWRTGQDSKPGFRDVYNAFDMLSPWLVGSFGGVDGAAAHQTVLIDDLADCDQRGKDYQPVVFAGFAWSNWHEGSPRNEIPRLGGRFMWQQFVNLRQLDIKNVYVAMFDEHDEGTAIAKAAPDKSVTPSNQYFLTLDEDGIQMSSDFYLRLVDDGNQMVQGLTPLRENLTTPYFP